MNVNVHVKTPGMKAFEMRVSVQDTDTVEKVIEQVATSQLLVFPERALLSSGQRLDPKATLSSCGLKTGASLEFVLEAGEQSVVKQLQDLCATRTLTFDELGLLYCYRHGLSLNQALKTLGLETTLKELVESHAEAFVVEGKSVSAAGKKAAAKPAEAKSVVTALRENNAAPKQEKKEKAPQEPKKKKADKNLPAPVAAAPVAAPLDATEDAPFQELHNKVSSRSFHSKIVQDLRKLQSAVEESCFLHVEEVVRGGPVGRGTALVGNEDSELVVFVRGLPTTGQEKWLPRLHKALAAAVQDKLGGEVEVTRAGVQFEQTTIKLTPAWPSYADAVQALGTLGPDSRPYFDAAFVRERNAFVGKQPGSVKACMRLLKWWRDQQAFSCDLTRPSDELLEYLAIYVAQQCGKQTLGQSVANCMGVLARLDELRVVWTNFYSQQDVWAPLMTQRPLLMDPVNPFRNVADPQEFDPREVVQLARTTSFW